MAFGLLLVDKPKGPTSHDVVAFVRWALRERAVGHCGTLDPAATGLLVVCVGEATKLVEHLTGVDKRYRARFVLGRSTTTADAEGETLAEEPVPIGLELRAGAVLEAMIGELSLPPPAFSAIKIAGRRAHELARAGEPVELPNRAMVIRGVEAIEFPEPGLLDATLEVGKGTYVRSIAEELGRRLGVPAHLGGLRRLACGRLDLQRSDAVSGLIADRLEPHIDESPRAAPRWKIHLGESGDRELASTVVRDRLIPPWACLPFETLVLEPSEVLAPLWARMRQGQRLGLDASTHAAFESRLSDADGLCALALPSAGELLIARRCAGRLAPERWIRFDPTPEPIRG